MTTPNTQNIQASNPKLIFILVDHEASEIPELQ